MKKRILALLCMAAAGLALSGCAAGNASTLNATTAPQATQMMATDSPASSMTPTTMPTDMPQTTQSMAPEAMTPAQAGKLAEEISEEVERISEVSEAQVVVHNERVLVAVEFDDQYSAGLDDRMKQMITEKVQGVDDGITDVEITDDDTIYGQVKGLGERVATVTGLDELADDFGDLWDRITGR